MNLPHSSLPSYPFTFAGCEPSIMGIGPVPASRAALAAIGKEVKDMDVVEVTVFIFNT